MNTNLKWVLGIVVALVLGVFLGAMLGGKGKMFGSINNGAAVINFPQWYTNGLYGGASQQFAVSSAGALTAGASTFNGNVTITTVAGCVQAYATSTLTPLALRFTASTTAPTNGSGVIPVISYGTCP